MNLKKAPWRAYEKYQLDGLEAAIRASAETFLINVLAYRGVYEKLLRGRLDRISREELRAMGNCLTYESCTGRIPTKQKEGIDREDSPSETYWPGDRFVCEIPDARVLGPVGPGLTDDGRIITETVAIPHKAERRIGVAVAKALVETGAVQTGRALTGAAMPERRFDTVALLYPPWNNYYHWTIETLPRIRSLLKYAAEGDSYPTLLVPSDRPSWIDETLRLIDYPGKIAGWSGMVAQTDRLVVPVFPDPTPEECRWLRDRMHTQLGDQPDVGGQQRIFVSRQDATVRQIYNIEEIGPILRRYGFESYVLSELSVKEQIKLFGNAEAVVGPHGAGLANLVYANNVSVLELFGGKMNASFARMAYMLDHEYSHMQCKQQGVNLVVNPERLDARLRSLLSTTLSVS